MECESGTLTSDELFKLCEITMWTQAYIASLFGYTQSMFSKFITGSRPIPGHLTKQMVKERLILELNTVIGDMTNA